MKGFSYSVLALLALLGVASAAIVCPPQQGEMAPNNIANPADCGSFYSCNNGVPILMYCYPGLHWNDRYKICDHPEDAQCTVTQKREVNIDSPKVKSASIAARSVVCPPQQGEMAPNNIANPEDCGSFYACNNGTPILMYCYPGLHWNDRYKICDHPENAKCTTTQKKEVKIDSPKVKSSSIAALSVVCPPQQGEMAPNNIANPEDCGSFYACNNGTPILMYCYPGLHWNDRYKICDHPEDAQCTVAQK